MGKSPARLNRGAATARHTCAARRVPPNGLMTTSSCFGRSEPSRLRSFTRLAQSFATSSLCHGVSHIIMRAGLSAMTKGGRDRQGG